MKHADALIIGAGVVGLTTGVRLQEAGVPTQIWTDRSILDTTSANSGAIWGPFLSKLDSRVLAWSFRSYEVLRGLAENPKSGVQMVDGLGAADFHTSTPTWVEQIGGQSHAVSLPSPYVCGWRYRVPVIDMPRYLEYLQRTFEQLGGVVVHRHVETPAQLVESTSHLVICAGFGARKLLNDRQLRLSKGQLVILENPGIVEFFAERGDGPELTYILPQGPQLILGGTAEATYTTETAEPAMLTAIIRRCARYAPALLSSRILGSRVGFRPLRRTVRLEHDQLADGTHLIYNYGHGGSGVSLSWGCADAVASLLRECVASNRRPQRRAHRRTVS